MCLWSWFGWSWCVGLGLLVLDVVLLGSNLVGLFVAPKCNHLGAEGFATAHRRPLPNIQIKFYGTGQ